MTDETVTHRASDPPPAPPNAWRAQRLRAGWPSVHVESVEATPHAGGHQVRAVVHLGDLTPADVCVGVTRAADAETLIAASGDCRGDDRMWSCASLHNGRYLFERVLRCDESHEPEWVVHVRPNDPHEARPVLYPLYLSRPDATRRSTAQNEARP